ncbi:DHH family phosphoesterase [Deferribacterales bacterium RsTz2092]|nr:DHH family phosphoesterase [Deferribacterales bacterium]
MINEIFESLAGKRRVLILTHNNPDPDAIGAAVGLKGLLALKKIKSTIAYMGVLGRLENREFVRQCKVDLKQSTDIRFKSFSYVVVVDTQPQAGNVHIPYGFSVNLIIDHHNIRKRLPKTKGLLTDIRPRYGSTSTIVTEYYKELGVVPDVRVATALCYGIMTDAIGRGRDSDKADQNMLGFIYPYVSLRKIAAVSSPDLPRYQFTLMRKAIDSTRLVGSLAFCDMGAIKTTDITAELADYLLRMREVKHVFVIGVYDKVAIFSLRAKSGNIKPPLSKVALKIVAGIGYGGGHIKSAGGQIILEDRAYEDVVLITKERLLKALGISRENSEGKPI